MVKLIFNNNNAITTSKKLNPSRKEDGLLLDDDYDSFRSDVGSVSSEESVNAKKDRKGSLVKNCRK